MPLVIRHVWNTVHCFQSQPGAFFSGHPILPFILICDARNQTKSGRKPFSGNSCHYEEDTETYRWHSFMILTEKRIREEMESYRDT